MGGEWVVNGEINGN